ncbi:sigma-E factor negative regulatory protein [Arenimonas fontis]|nr:sigma-E factor negative regulatory protein [Arenimonas fontis]
MNRDQRHEELPADLREQLCAWMDGELPPDQAAFLQRRLAHDPDLRALWERWQLASACLRGQPLRLMPAGWPARLGERLAASTAIPDRRRSWPWALGLAAAVVLAALLPRMAGREPGPGLPDAPALAGEAAPLVAPALGPVSPDPRPATLAVAGGPQAKPWPRSPLAPGAREMEAYLVRHNALVGDQGLGGFMPYVDVVAHDAGDPVVGEATAATVAEGDGR